MKYVMRPEDVPSYSPANHSGTKNYRMVAPGVNGAKYMEIIFGDIERHEGAVAHMHPELEQATYVIEGEAKVEVGGEKYHVKAGDLLFFPSKVYHDIQVITERIKLLVIYSPPYGEDPSKVVKMPQEGALEERNGSLASPFGWPRRYSAATACAGAASN